MTVSNTTARTSATGTNTAGQTISFSFPINATSDLVVKSRVTATGAEATLVEGTDYTVSINGDSGGTVTMVAAWANTYKLWVLRSTPRTQGLDLEQGGTFNAENIEEMGDKACRIANDLKDQQNRSLRAPDTDASTLDMELPDSVSRASQYLAFDANGEPTVVDEVAPDTATITAYMVLALAKANEADLKAYLNLETGTDVQAYSALLAAIAALAVTDGNIIVGNGSTWVAESGATARTSLGAAAAASVVNITEVVGYDDAVVMYDDEIVVYA